MFTKIFWIDAGERAIRTIAQTLAATVTGLPILDAVSGRVDFDGITQILLAGGITSGFAGLAALLTAIAASRTGGTNSASSVLNVQRAKDGG